MSGTHPTVLAAQIVAIVAAMVAVVLDTMAFGPRILDPAYPTMWESFRLLLWRPEQELSLPLFTQSLAALTVFVTAAAFGHISPKDAPSGPKWAGCILLPLGIALVIGVVDVIAIVMAITYVAWQAARGVAFISRHAITHRTGSVTAG